MTVLLNLRDFYKGSSPGGEAIFFHAQQSMKIILLINRKMPTIIPLNQTISISINSVNFSESWVEHEKLYNIIDCYTTALGHCIATWYAMARYLVKLRELETSWGLGDSELLVPRSSSIWGILQLHHRKTSIWDFRPGDFWHKLGCTDTENG